MKRLQALSRREREIMDIVYRAGEATANDVRGRTSDPPSYSAVRATLKILENKGLLKHQDDGTRFLYRPRLDRKRARQSAISHLVETFFDGSAAGAVMALLERPGEISESDFRRMTELIDRARKEGR
jgi:predicted transcriptional regulator